MFADPRTDLDIARFHHRELVDRAARERTRRSLRGARRILERRAPRRAAPPGRLESAR